MNRYSIFGSAWVAVFFFLVGAATAQTTAADDLRQGNQFYAQKDYENAARSYQTAITLAPTSASAYQGLGNCDYFLGKKAEALQAYQKSLELNPQNSLLAAFVERLKPSVIPVGQPTAAVTVIPEKAPAPQEAVSAPVTKTIELSAMGGVPFTNLVQAGGIITGVGGGVDGDYLVQPWLGLGLSTGYHSFNYEYNSLTILTGTGSVVFRDQVSLGYWDFLANAKFRLATQGFSPYLFGGAGICVNSVSTSIDQVTTANSSSPATTTKLGISSNSFVYPEIAGGLGLAILFDPGLGAFIQGKYCLVFNGIGNASFVPVEGGLDLLF